MPSRARRHVLFNRAVDALRKRAPNPAAPSLISVADLVSESGLTTREVSQTARELHLVPTRMDDRRISYTIPPERATA